MVLFMGQNVNNSLLDFVHLPPSSRASQRRHSPPTPNFIKLSTPSSHLDTHAQRRNPNVRAIF